jgi:uncharacterized protein YbjT (DUF2867 family)
VSRERSSAPPDADDGLVLVTGATGYVGGRLLTALVARGTRVRCVTRRPEFLRRQVGPGVEVVAADLREPRDVARALDGVTSAYYLAHSMGTPGGFADEDRTAAATFAEAAAAAGLRRIVYLGGLGHGEDLSEHLASRQEVGSILARSGVPTIELRSSIIIGAGSLSYDLIRSLVSRLPVMVTPRWVRTMTQPIAIDDVVAYLIAALDLPPVSRIYEIGGRDRVSYGDLMREYAEIRGLRRLVIPVPVLSPRLSSLWLGLVTPLYARVGRHLVDGLRNETVVRDPAALREMPVRPRGVREAIATAIAEEERAGTRWQDAVRSRSPLGVGGRPLRKQIVDSRWVRVAATPDAAFAPIQSIGGRTGWYYGNALWHIRGLIDLAFGGVGMRRGRRDPVELVPGDTVDFWRVEAIEPPSLLRLVAEMRLPGRAWLEFRVEPDGDGSIIRQTAFFDPSGLRGRLYWYLLAPAHQFMFPKMLRGIAASVTPPEPTAPAVPSG